MDERTWLTSHEGDKMLIGAVHATPRQYRLIAAACARLVLRHAAQESCLKAIEIAELFADELATGEQRRQAEISCYDTRRTPGMIAILQDAGLAARAAAGATVWLIPSMAANRVIEMSTVAAAPWRFEDDHCVHQGNPDAKIAHLTLVANIIREICGNPFRPVIVPATCRAWDSGQVGRLAEAIYAERRYQELPVLADALEDAGCTEPVLLSHLRGGGPHVRGCWALDLARGTNVPQEISG